MRERERESLRFWVRAHKKGVSVTPCLRFWGGLKGGIKAMRERESVCPFLGQSPQEKRKRNTLPPFLGGRGSRKHESDERERQRERETEKERERKK